MSSSKSLIDSIYLQQKQFFDGFDNYAFGLAATADPEAIRRLFTAMPFLLSHTAQRPLPNDSRDWRMLSLPWAIFSDTPSYTSKLRECVRVLRDVGFKPDALFCERMIWRVDLDMLKDVCEVFALEACTTVSGDGFPLMMRAAGEIKTEEGLAQFRYLLDQATDVEVRSSTRKLTTLYSVFTDSRLAFDSEGAALQVIDWLLEAGASPNVEGLMTGWAHNGGKGEYLPLLHGVYWSRYTGRTTDAIVARAEAVCDQTQLDSQGRTARQYAEWLEQTKAPK